jgi:hypothetical protein
MSIQNDRWITEMATNHGMVVPPNSFALARSVEYFRIPRDVVTITVGKSTYARCGIITNVTPFEPEWEGHVTLEISNTTPLPRCDFPCDHGREMFARTPPRPRGVLFVRALFIRRLPSMTVPPRR